LEEAMNFSRLTAVWVMLPLLLSAGCRTADNSEAPASEQRTLVVASHSSFSVSEDVLKSFEEANNAAVRYLDLGDAGEALNKVILSRDAPLADVFFGVDNTFLSRALNADVFEAYDSPMLESVPDELELDAENRLLPVDVGYININADREWFAQEGIAFPQTLEDLTGPEYKSLLVVQNPATSSPGLAFLLATVDAFGEDGYLDYWAALRENDVLVADGWSEAYYDHFTVGSGGSGSRPLVVGYSTSPPADVLYAEDGRTEPGSINISPPGETFRQIEFVGVLKGTEQPELARAFVDFVLDETFQNDLPLQMFVYPANENAVLPRLFVEFAEVPADPAGIEPAEIERNREAWITAWTDTVLR
jgi:thiamine transport system substrate-binding protein